MAIEYIGTALSGYVWEIQGTSTDVKPAVGPGNDTLGAGSAFRELDTGTIYAYSAANTNPATTSGWWEVTA
jgi:hypothetical protein